MVTPRLLESFRRCCHVKAPVEYAFTKSGFTRSFFSSNANQRSVAVIGSGPSGLYFVDRLRRLCQESVSIDVFERLPTPFGLVRSGVAPDHPDTKNVTSKFTELCSSPGVRFFGNVNVGADITIHELKEAYNAIVLAYGAEDDRSLGIAQEDTYGVISARTFVNWYNGHPGYIQPAGLPPLEKVVNVGIVGLGNVALDCARVLLKLHRQLEATDIADHALTELEKSAVKTVHIIGRRGPFQTQFSGKEFREVLSLPDISVHVHPKGYEPTEFDRSEPRKAQKCYGELVKAQEKTSSGQEMHKQLHFHFLGKPHEIRSNANQISSLELLVKSLGTSGRALDGVPFDRQTGTIPNILGRVTDTNGGVVAGLYTTGWIKRGSKGIIGTNILCAEQTARCVVEDLESHKREEIHGDMYPVLQAKGVEVVTWDGWKRIDHHERVLGAERGKPRVKLTDVRQMLDIASGEIGT